MNAYPISSLLGCLIYVMRHEPRAGEHQTALASALRMLIEWRGLNLEADPEAFTVNGTEVPLAAPGATLVNEQLLGHGIRHVALAPEYTDGDMLRFAGVLATFAGTYDSIDAFQAALGPAGARISLTPGTGDLEIRRSSPWRPRSVFEPVDEGVILDIPGLSTGDTAEFEQFREITFDSTETESPLDESMPSQGSTTEPRPPLDVLLKRGRDAIAREDWPGLLEVSLQIVEAEAEAPSDLASSTHRIELKRLLSRRHLTMVARLAHGEHKQSAIALLRRFGADATEVLMDLLVGAMNMSERRGYYSALTQMSEGTDSIIQHLGNQHWYVVRNAADLCGDMELADAVPELARQISHPDERVRKAVASALARIATPAATEPLKILLTDPATTVRVQTVANLSGRRARALGGAVGDLLKKETDADVQHEALLALGRIGSPEAVTILKEWASPGGKLIKRRPIGLRLTAIRGLAMIGPAAGDALSALQRDDVPEVRTAATQAVAGLRPA